MVAVELFESERCVFDAHKSEWLATHRDEYVVIKGNRIIGFFPTHRDAYESSIRAIGNVDMLIRKVTEDEPSVTVPLVARPFTVVDPR